VKNVNIFEVKDHNDPAYVGQVPVISVPEDVNKRVQTGNNDEIGYPYPHGVRNAPNADVRLGLTGDKK
jgi:hypothetical protein